MIDRFSRVIVDTDVCIHRYLVEEELVSGPIREHMQELMAEGILCMLDPNTVLSQVESVIYHATAAKFAQVHGVDLSKSR